MKIIQEFTSSRGWPTMLLAGSRLVCAGRNVCVYDTASWKLIHTFKTVFTPIEDEKDEHTLYLDFWLVNRRLALLDEKAISNLPNLEKPHTSILATMDSFLDCVKRRASGDFPGLIVGEAISPDRSKVFFCGEGHLGILYDSSSLTQIAKYAFKNKNKCLYSPAFSNCGQFIAVSNTGSELFVIDTKAGTTREFSFPKLDVRPLAWTQDDKNIIVAAKKKILFVDPGTGQITREIAIKTDAYFALQSKDAKYLLLGFHAKWNSSLHLVDLATEKVLYKHELNGFGHDFGIGAVFIDENRFAVATDVVSIVEIATGKLILELAENQGVFTEIALSPEEDVFLGDGRLGRIVNFRTGKETAQWKDLPKLEAQKTLFSKDGKSIIAHGSDTLYVFDKKKAKNDSRYRMFARRTV